MIIEDQFFSAVIVSQCAQVLDYKRLNGTISYKNLECEGFEHGYSGRGDLVEKLQSLDSWVCWSIFYVGIVLPILS